MEAEKTQPKNKPYPTDISDKDWARIEHLIPLPRSDDRGSAGGRSPKYDRREIMLDVTASRPTVPGIMSVLGII